MTKSRKRMLLSSVAMLLVALVALGSATYAWFSVSKTVKAENMVVKSIASAGLEISKDNVAWGTLADYAQDATSNYDIKPVTWDTSGNGAIPEGNVDAPGGAYTGSTWKDTGVVPPTPSANSQKNTYFATYKVWVRSASAVAHTVEAKVTATGDNANFVRARLVDVSTPTNTRNYADASSLTSDAFAAKAADGTAASVTASAFGSTKSGSTYGYDVSGTAADQVGKEFTFIVWFDGMDTDCKDTAKDKLATLEIAFTATDM